MDIFVAVAEPTRRTIVEMLAESGQLPATAIYQRFPVSASAISQHLKVLQRAMVVTVEKQAQQRIYRINPQAMHELEAWAKRMADRCEERFAALDAVLGAEQAKLSKPAGKD